MKNQKKTITVALQGGGSHGAFTWGVLDRLLEEETLEIKGISGTSAGAINGALVATGLVTEGNDKAKTNLNNFWKDISNSYSFSPSTRFQNFIVNWNPLDNSWMTSFFNLFTDYDFTTSRYDPLKRILDDHLEFECLRKTNKIQIYVSATNVETNRIKVFTNEDICTASLLASSCLPTIRQAVEWKGEFYWDGAFIGNPILEPLIYNFDTKDLLIVQVNPVNKPGIPKTPREILDRLNEVTFNSSLMREIRGIVNIQKLSEGQWCDPRNPYSYLRLHLIDDEVFMAKLGESSKFNVNWDFLTNLKEKGRQSASKWLDNNYKHLGVCTSMDLTEWKLETPTTTCLTWNKGA